MRIIEVSEYLVELWRTFTALWLNLKMFIIGILETFRNSMIFRY